MRLIRRRLDTDVMKKQGGTSVTVSNEVVYSITGYYYVNLIVKAQKIPLVRPDY